MCGRATYRILSPKRTSFQIGIDWRSHLRKVLRRGRIGHAYPMWLWGCSLFKIPSPRPVFRGTKWLLWRPNIQSPTFHSMCRLYKGFIKRKSTIDHWRSWCKGWILWSTPYTYIYTYKWIHWICSGHSWKTSQESSCGTPKFINVLIKFQYWYFMAEETSWILFVQSDDGQCSTKDSHNQFSIITKFQRIAIIGIWASWIQSSHFTTSLPKDSIYTSIIQSISQLSSLRNLFSLEHF
jgi:hypothetical protein